MVDFPPEKAPKRGLNIYGCAAVNPYKLTIAAEEIGIPYNYVDVDMFKAENKSEWFTSINPNGRMPAIVHVKEDGTSVSVFESGACLLYIASEFDKENKVSYPVGTPEYWSQLSWLSWQISGYGPMLGQAAHFNRYSAEKVPYGVWRYTAESRRLNDVLNKQLATCPFVAGDRLTVADIAVYVYAKCAKWCGIDTSEFPHVKAWVEKLDQRPAFQKGLQVPKLLPFRDDGVTNPDADAQDYYKTVRKFGTQGIKAATEEWKGDPVPLPSDHANHGDF